MQNTNQFGCVNNFFCFTKEKNNDKDKHKSIIKEAHNEIELTNIIKTIKNYKTRYNVYQDCSKIILNSTYTNLFLFKYENIELINFQNYLKALSTRKKYIKYLIEGYIYLLVSLELITQKGIVHLNLENDAIVLKDDIYFIISNFDKGIIINDKICIDKHIHDKFVNNSKNICYYPIEIYILFFLKKHNLDSISRYNLETIIEEYITNNSLLKVFGIENYKKEAYIYYEKYINKDLEYIKKDIFSYYKTWDLFSLSVIFLYELIDFYNNKTNKKKNKFIILFMKLLIENICTNPKKRPSILESSNKFNELIYNTDINTFKDVIS